MSLVNLTVKDFINEVDSKSPAPGGGSVSALASSLGVGLSRMVSHLTIGKKKYLELSETIRKEYEDSFETLEGIKEKLGSLIDKDTEAFNKIMAAFKLPKETEEEKAIRKDAILEATKEAIEVPYEIARLSYKALIIIEKMFEYGNKNAITDIGVGTLLLYSGLEGAILNVKINLSGLKDEDEIKHYKDACENLLKEGQRIKGLIIRHVHDAISE